MTKSKDRPLIVAIAGGSGAGKSWLADRLQKSLGRNAVRISLDDFYRDRSGLPLERRAKINFDHPRAIDWPRVERVLRDCLAGRAARVPSYDFKTHCRLKTSKILNPKPIILVDGLWLLRRPSLRSLFGLRIFLDLPTRIRLRRRVARDLRSRGRTGASIRRQFWSTVAPMHAHYVASQIRWADVVLKGSFGRREVKKLAADLRARVKKKSAQPGT